MIQISSEPFQQIDMWPAGGIESTIAERMIKDPTVYSYQSIDQLSFEIKLRKNIILSARSMNQSNVAFAVFKESYCNPRYWLLTGAGGFLLRHDVKPSDAIQDIYLNSSQYAFECATAMVIIYYHAVLTLIGENLFNQLFQGIYLYSWHGDSDLGIKPYYTNYMIPGDVVYINNPDFDPLTSQWRGENAVILEDGTYFGLGIGITTEEHIIRALNQQRERESNQSAYLTNLVTRPSFKHLSKAFMSHRGYSIHKYRHIVFHHNESSVSLDQYMFLINMVYNNMVNIKPFLQ